MAKEASHEVKSSKDYFSKTSSKVDLIKPNIFCVIILLYISFMAIEVIMVE